MITPPTYSPDSNLRPFVLKFRLLLRISLEDRTNNLVHAVHTGRELSVCHGVLRELQTLHSRTVEL